MNLSQFFQQKIIGRLRAHFGQNNVQASSIGAISSIGGHIIRDGNEADLVFRLHEDEQGIVLSLGVMRSDVQNQSDYIENPELIYDCIVGYAKEWSGVEQSGRLTSRAEHYEKINGTLTGVNPSKWDGLDDVKAASTFEDENNEIEVKEVK